jgi:arylsulfatase A-like enzyme
MNLILITIDALRADHLGCLGYPRKTTPNLDYLAGEGVLFTQAISTSQMTPGSFPSLFTSTFPFMNGGWFDISKRGITLAQVLKQHGYHTGAFVSNPWLSSYYGYHNGFDVLEYSIPESRMEVLYKPLSRLCGRSVKPPPAPAHELNKKAITWLHDNRGNFFLWLHYMDVHGPYGLIPTIISLSRRLPRMMVHQASGHSTHRARQSNNLLTLLIDNINRRIDLYDAQLRYVDKMLSSLLHTLTELDILRNTFIVVTADHGQEFMEHGRCGHAFGLYDELIHVPLIIIGPGLPSQVISRQVSLLDLAPTILDIVGIEKPKTFLGDSLLGLMRGTEIKGGKLGAISETDVPPGRSRLWESQKRMNANRRVISFRTSKWKYIYTEGGQDELYCLETDPGERENLIDAELEIATELRANIAAHIEFEEKSTPSEKEQIKAKLTKLKAAGKI